MSDEPVTGGTPKGAPRPVNPLLKGLAIGIGTVVLLAAVIFVGSALSNSRKPAGQTPGLSKASQSRLAYEQGVDALAAGETTKAVALLEKAVKLDSKNNDAKEALTQAKTKKASGSGSSSSGSGAGSGTGSGSGSTSGDGAGGNGGGGESTGTPDAPQVDDPVFSTEISDLTKLLPAAVEGYSAGTRSESQGTAQLSGTPVSDTSISRANWTVNDRGSAEKAKKFMADVSGELYDKDVAQVNVDGAHARFATDGTLFASVVYVRGRYVFEVVLTSTNRKPEALKSAAEAAAAAFPDSL